MIYKSDNFSKPVEEPQQVNEFLLAALGCVAALSLLGNGLAKIAETASKIKKNYEAVSDLFKNKDKDKDKGKDKEDVPKSGEPKKEDEPKAAEEQFKLTSENNLAIAALVQKKINESGSEEDKTKFQQLSMCMFDRDGKPISPEKFQENATAILGEGGIDKLAKESAQSLKDANVNPDAANDEIMKMDPVERAQLITQTKSTAVNGHFKAEADKAKKENEEAMKKLEEDRDKAIDAANKLKTAERDAAIEAANKEFEEKKKTQEDAYNQRVEKIDNDRKSAVEKTVAEGAERENATLEAKIAEKRNAAGNDPEALEKVEKEAKQMREDLKAKQEKAKSDAVEGGSVKPKKEGEPNDKTAKKEGEPNDKTANKEGEPNDKTANKEGEPNDKTAKKEGEPNDKTAKKDDNDTFTDPDGTEYKKDGDKYIMKTKDGDTTELSKEEFETQKKNNEKKKDEKTNNDKTQDKTTSSSGKPADVKNPKKEWKKVPSKIKGGKPHFQSKNNPDSTMSLKDWNERMQSYHKAKKNAEQWNKEHPDDLVKVESMETDIYDMLVEVMQTSFNAMPLTEFLKR